MKTDLYQKFVTLLRQQYSALSIENIITDIEEAVETFGIEIKYSDMSHINIKEVISGYVHVVDGSPEIVINGFQNKYRQRFTIAHELGHILLHWEWLPGKKLPESLVEISFRKETYSLDEKERERQADCFAAEFLSPINDVVDFLKDIEASNLDKEVQISMISDRYRISNSAAYYRWKDAKKRLHG